MATMTKGSDSLPLRSKHSQRRRGYWPAHYCAENHARRFSTALRNLSFALRNEEECSWRPKRRGTPTPAELCRARIMNLRRRQFLHLGAGAAGPPAVSRTARAQAYPSRPITMVVPFAPGGLTDVLGRVLAAGMQTLLVQSVVVENVGGASGSIGTGRVARAAPDGYTVVLGIWNTHVANGVTYTLDYDVVKDFAPIVLCA